MAGLSQVTNALGSAGRRFSGGMSGYRGSSLSRAAHSIIGRQANRGALIGAGVGAGVGAYRNKDRGAGGMLGGAISGGLMGGAGGYLYGANRGASSLTKMDFYGAGGINGMRSKFSPIGRQVRNMPTRDFLDASGLSREAFSKKKMGYLKDFLGVDIKQKLSSIMHYTD